MFLFSFVPLLNFHIYLKILYTILLKLEIYLNKDTKYKIVCYNLIDDYIIFHNKNSVIIKEIIIYESNY